MKKPRAPRHTPRYDLLVEECRRRNRIAEQKADREAEERWKNRMEAERQRWEAEHPGMKYPE